jgi:hypothetical protein
VSDAEIHGMQTRFEYYLALAYAAVASLGWFIVAVRQWTVRERYSAAALQFYAEGNGASGLAAMGIAGARLSEVYIAAILMAIFSIIGVALARRTWNGWDWASALAGLATVPSLIFLCASGRVIFAAPFTLGGLWILLYRPGVKAVCGVGADEPRPIVAEGTVAVFDPAEERNHLTGLLQSLRVFEVERGMDTDVFVTRYTQGLEDDSEDNQEWFALARLARRSQERLASLNGDPGSSNNVTPRSGVE